jgi:hypothetical protein
MGAANKNKKDHPIDRGRSHGSGAKLIALGKQLDESIGLRVKTLAAIEVNGHLWRASH